MTRLLCGIASLATVADLYTARRQMSQLLDAIGSLRAQLLDALGPLMRQLLGSVGPLTARLLGGLRPLMSQLLGLIGSLMAQLLGLGPLMTRLLCGIASGAAKSELATVADLYTARRQSRAEN